MNQETLDKLDKIADDLLVCRVCSFHNQLREKNLPFKPDAPLLNDTQKSMDYKVISVGINPGWNDDLFYSWRDIYAITNLKEYKDETFKWWKELLNKKHKVGPQPYMYSLYHTFSTINFILNIYDAPIKREEIYNYVFWANLSWCNSQKPTERKFFGNEIKPCKVEEEEIPNCLDKGYIKRIIEAIAPKLVIFLGLAALNDSNFKKIFDENNYCSITDYHKTTFPKNIKKNKTIRNGTIVARKLVSKDKQKETYVLFLQHPNGFRYWDKTYREKALQEVCGWLKG